MSAEIRVGSLVTNPSKPDWGLGKVKLEAQRVHVVWRNVLNLQPKVMIPSALVLAEVQNDPFLDSLSEGKGSRKSRSTKNQVISYQPHRTMFRRDFVGFTQADFAELAGSAWRGRHSLGGLLAGTLKSSLKRPYKSWGVKRRLELHLANENHYSSADPFPYPKLFVYSKELLSFRFYIEAPLDPTRPDAVKYTYWRAFRKQLQEDNDVLDLLLQTMDKHQLMLVGLLP